MKERISFWLEKEIIDAVEDYWHENRLKSRTDAIRELLRIALDVVKKRKDQKQNRKNSHT